MTDTARPTTRYRVTQLPGYGRMQVPAHLNDAEILDQLAAQQQADARTDAAPKPKAKRRTS